MAISYDEYINKNKKKKKKEEPKVVLGYSPNQNNVKNTPRSTTDTQTLIDRYIAEQKAKGDIAPVKKKEGDGLFSAFEDGYQMGDVSKTILKGGKKLGKAVYKTGKEIVTNPVESFKAGMVGIGEGINKANDLTNDAVDDFFDFITGRKKEDKDLSVSIIDIDRFSKTASEEEKQKVLKEYEKKYGKDSQLYKSVELSLNTKGKKEDTNVLNMKYYDTDTYDKAVEGKLSDGQQNIYNIGQTVGNIVPATVVSAVLSPAVGKALFFTQAQQGYTEEARARGYDEKDARIYGMIMGGFEVAVERLGFDELGGFKGLAKGNIIKNMVGEGMEEFVMPYIDDVVTYVGFEDGYGWEEFRESSEEALEGAVMGAVVGGIFSAGGKGLSKVDKVIQKATNGETITQYELIEARDQLQETHPEVMQEAIVGVAEQLKKSKSVGGKQEEVQDVTSEDIAPVPNETDIIENLQENNIPILEGNEYQQASTTETTVEADETALRSQNYVYQASETDSEYRRNLNEDASKYANNTTRTHEFVNTLANVSEASGLNIRLTNNTSPEMTQRKQAMINSYAKRNNVSVQEASERLKNIVIDGYNVNDQITINVNSPKALNRLVGHEITHSLEKTVVYKTKLQKIAIDYAKSKNDYKSRLDRLIDLYEGQNADINKELTADIIGDYLFTDQKFVDNLYKKDRNLFQRIYDEIKHLINMVTAGSKEARELEKLKHSFEKAMRENKEMSKESKKATVQETKDKSAVEVESNTQEKEDSVQKTEKEEEYSLSEELENNLDKVMQSKKDQINFFKDYLKENNIKNPTEQDMYDSWGTYEQMDSDMDNYVEAEKEYYKTIREYLDELSKVTKDSEGNKLSEAQIEFFKDSVVRDENGNLLVMYHGTRADFYTFESDRTGQNYEDSWSRAGKGFYFTPEKKVAKDYGEASVDKGPVKIKEVYLNITSPFDMATDYTETLKDMKAEYNIDDFYLKAGYRLIDWFRDAKIDSTEVLKKYGFDGIHDFDDYIAFESNQIKDVDNTNPTESDDIRYSLSDRTDAEVKEALLDTRDNVSERALKKMREYIAEQRPNLFNEGTDNLGRKLAPGMKNYMKDSKVRDVNDSLTTVYHTVNHGTIQFNEFNPVGTPRYKYGDQVVNFYTNSKVMSGSYADQRYEMADTKKLNNIEEVNQWLETQDARPVLEVDNLPEPTTDNEKFVYRMIKEFGEGKKYVVINKDSTRVLAIFENERDLIRNAKAKVTAGQLDVLKNYQYEGYINITNPYVIDAEGKSWGEVSQSVDTDKISRLENLRQSKKAELIELAQESKDRYDIFISSGKNRKFSYMRSAMQTQLSEMEQYQVMLELPLDDPNKLITYGYGRETEQTLKLEDFVKEYKELETLYKNEGESPRTYFDTKYSEVVTKDSPIYDIDRTKVYLIARDNFKDIDRKFTKALETNDIVKQVIEMNKNGSNYDGVIFKDVVDYGGSSNGDPSPSDVYVTFNSNQFKNWDNENPTDDPDIRYSLSDTQEDRINKLNAEYESWLKTRDITFDERDALRKELNDLIRSEEFKEANERFMSMVREGISPNEIEKTSEYQMMAQEQQIRNRLKEYDEDIRVMTEDMTRIAEMIENEEKSHRTPEDAIIQAKDFFGITNDFREAGYLLQDGTLLDFSGRTQGSNTYGKRTLDHREINEVGYDMDEFIELGNIRMKPESSGFELSKPLTKEQKSMLRDYLNTLNDDIMIDITKEGKVLYDSATYKKGTPTSKIFNDLDYYFENGKFPKQSKYAEFMYSLSRTDDIAPVGENDIFGSDIAVQEQVKEAIAPLQEQIETLTKTISDLQENMAPASFDLAEEQRAETQRTMTDEDAPLTDEGTFSFLDEEVKVKKKQEIINDIASDFNIKKTEARELYNKIESIPELTIDDVYTELENYRKVKFKEQDDYVKSIQDYIRGTKLDISNIKKQIPDYGNVYRMSNMGKGLILGNSGQGVDTFYQELNELFPNEFPSDVVAEADQLELISQAMYKEKEFTYVDILDDDELQILAERIYADIGNSERYRHTQSGLYFLNKEVKKMAPPGEINTNISEEEYADSLTTLDASNTEQTEETVSLEEELNELDRQKGPSIKKNPFDEVLDKFLEGKRTEKTKSVTPKVEKTKYRNAVDTAQRLFVNEMVESDNLAKESGNLNIKYTGDMLNNVAGEIEGEIYTAQTDNEGHQIGKSLSALFSEAKKTGLYDAFNDYLEQYSNIDRHAQDKGSVVPLADSQRLVRHYEKTYPEFKQWGKGVWQYGANIRNNLIDAGIINEEFAETLGSMYPHYVPYMENREMTNYNPDLGEIKPKGVIKRAVGGADNLLPIEEALTKYTFASKKAVRQNQFYQEIVATLDNKVEVGADVRSDALDLEDTLYRDETGNYLTAYFNGERLSVRISDDLYTGLRNDLKGQIKGLEEKFALITDPVQKLSEWRRNLLTSWNPMFIIKNPIMDVQDALFNSKYTKDFAKNYPKAFVELGQAKSETAKQFLTLYGSGNVMGEYSSDGSVKSNKFLRGIERANNIMELAPRYAEFKASLENGASLQEAMYNAREVTTNFGRGGVITKALNKNGFTFLNVSVQGFDKFIRNFSGENGAKGVTGALLKATLLGVIPAVFNELAFGGDDEEKDEDYDALPDYIKDNYYLIKTGDGQFIRIPKGRILSVFGSAGRRTIEYLQGEEDAFEGYLKNANSQIGISNPLDSNILTPLFQAFGSENGEAWYGGDIVPTRLQSKAPKEQYDASTDKFSIWLGDKIGVSPYKINYVIDQYSGGMGDIFLPFITEESTSDAEGIELALAPIKDQFTANSTFDNKYAGDIYDLSDKMDKMPSSVKNTDEYKIQDAYLYSVTSEMGKLYAERRAVQENKELSKKEKYEKVQEIQKQINALAKEGLDNYEDVNSTSNYAIVGGREFNKYKTESGETRWGAVREEELEALNSYGLDIMEKSSYFNAKTYISQAQEKYKDTEDYTQKKRDIIAVIKSTLLTDEAKAYLYDKYYADSETLNTITSLGIDFDKYLDLEYQNFEADKNSAGKSISGSKKAKVFNYINSMDLSFEEKLVLTKLQYNSYNEHNGTVINYINSADLTYEQRVNILKKLGFKVDDYGNIKW